ncbi:THO complex subunit 1 [Erysiphe neolycopersici]|uniref:THO complex subunit 1 n=1 Tax=Erysiphe neolycopersici TaxID=212602 RepID=A0A420HMN8_9PEZI|nr:THO complex subunit 1 [Erysiphe neolycopersici]
MAPNEAPSGMLTVDGFANFLQSLLRKAHEIKKTDKVDPALHKSDFPGLLDEIKSIFHISMSTDSRKQVIDAAVRNTFYNLLASTSIDNPSFINMWNLLDIVSILSDEEQTEPGLLFWLVEELLDSQTVAGCRNVFDYLESRRETIIAKHFGSKNLIILRSCNELLRRLSRAEDTAFCGRVFIFLFQSFPLGDKSSVNLRGEYHTENITTFDSVSHTMDSEHMSLGPMLHRTRTSNPQKESFFRGIKQITEDSPSPNSATPFMKNSLLMSADQLYPLFWSLQKYFSQPKELFDRTVFSSFKVGLESTMLMFKSVQRESNVDRVAKSTEDSRRGLKRKRGSTDDGLANTFNPKYLTSRDLFELEIRDLSFRRHVLVQSLIILDFLLSLSAKSKEKLSKAIIDNPNKSVIYTDQILSWEDVRPFFIYISSLSKSSYKIFTNWVIEMKRFIAEYLKQSHDGPFFFRMVETVLSRDKNWARWKIENCPSITRPAITPQDLVEARLSARKVTTNKKLRPNPIDSFDFNFLVEDESHRGIERLRDPSRFSIPSVSSFKSKIETDDLDLEMASSQEEKNLIIQSKASKSWRALRVASTTKLFAFDKIERSDKIDAIFQEQIKSDEANNGEDEVVEDENQTQLKDAGSNVKHNQGSPLSPST